MKISRDKWLADKAERFISLLKKIDLNDLGLSAYNLAYAQRYLERPYYNLYLSCFNLELAGKLDQYGNIIDLGGGVGIHSAFLSFLEIDAEIIYIDVDPDSTTAAKTLHRAMGLDVHSYHTGELMDLEDKLNHDSLIMSRDVIEHVYDLASFFELSSKAGLNIHNTAAIQNSLFRYKEFEKIHEMAEFKGNSSEHIKSRDSKRSYFNLREEIIRELSPDLNATQLAIAVNQTRGLMEKDIKAFIEHGILPPYHKKTLHSNTCDPYTGNWAERTLTPADYALYAKDIQLDFHYPKYNALDHRGLKRMSMKALNIFASLPLQKIQPSFSIVY